MTDLVDEAIRSSSLLVFLFHGVGGGHSLNVELKRASGATSSSRQKRRMCGWPQWWMWRSMLRREESRCGEVVGSEVVNCCSEMNQENKVTTFGTARYRSLVKEKLPPPCFKVNVPFSVLNSIIMPAGSNLNLSLADGISGNAACPVA